MGKWLKNTIIVVGIGLGVSASIVLIRKLSLKGNRGEFYVSNDSKKRENEVTLHVKVPKPVLGYIIGKKGATVKKLRQEYDTIIKFQDLGDDSEAVIITGASENAAAAAAKVRELMSERPSIYTEDMFIPLKTWNLVCGVNGDNMRFISNKSNAVLNLKWSPNDDYSMHHITVQGKREQVDMAISMIDEKIAEKEVIQQKAAVGLAGRSLPDNPDTKMNRIATYEAFPNDSPDGFVPVFVSAVQDPSHFWVQLCGPKSTQLDKLCEQMTEFYTDSTNRSNFSIKSVNIGDLVAAFNDGDKDWYRAVVLSVEEGNKPDSATVLYVDFGDCGMVESTLICKLKADFLVIPFQAIKCCLHGISPTSKQWSSEACSVFEKLTYLAQWKVLMAKPIVIPINDNGGHDSAIDVELIDTNQAADLNVADELVKTGHAIKVQKS